MFKKIPSSAIDFIYAISTNVLTLEKVGKFSNNNLWFFGAYCLALIVFSAFCQKSIKEAMVNFIVSLVTVLTFSDNIPMLIVTGVAIELIGLLLNSFINLSESLISKDKGKLRSLNRSLIIRSLTTCGILLFCLYYYTSCPEAFTNWREFSRVFLCSSRNFSGLIGQSEYKYSDALPIGFLVFTSSFWVIIGFSSYVIFIVLNFRQLRGEEIFKSFLLLPINIVYAILTAWLFLILMDFISLIFAIPLMIITVIVMAIPALHFLVLIIAIPVFIMAIAIVSSWFFGGWTILSDTYCSKDVLKHHPKRRPSER